LPVCRPSAWHRRIGGSGFQAGTQCSEPVRRQAGRRGKRPRHCDAAEHNGAELTLNLTFQHVRERRHAAVSSSGSPSKDNCSSTRIFLPEIQSGFCALAQTQHQAE